MLPMSPILTSFFLALRRLAALWRHSIRGLLRLLVFLVRHVRRSKATTLHGQDPPGGREEGSRPDVCPHASSGTLCRSTVPHLGTDVDMEANSSNHAGFIAHTPSASVPEIVDRTTGSYLQSQPPTPSLVDPGASPGDTTSAVIRQSRSFKCIFPITGSWIERYARRVIIPKVESRFMIGPYTTNFQRNGGPPGWTPLTHPEGALYFYNEGKRIYTDAYLYDAEVLAYIDNFMQQIEALVQDSNVSLCPDVEMVMELLPAYSDGEIMCGYYFVDHVSRTLFWPVEFEADFLLREVKGVTALDHVKHVIEAQYWLHWMLFPNRNVTPELVQELKEILVHAVGDAMTSNTTTGTYSVDELRNMLSLVKHMKITPEGRCHGHSACLMGRLMNIFSELRFLHFHGQNGARLSRDQTVHGQCDESRSMLIQVLSPFLFYAPDAHLRTLNSIYVDRLVSLGSWKPFITRLNDGWQGFTLFGTVLLNVNVAFLAIPTVDVSRRPSTRSASELASYLSIITTIASIIIGLMLLRQNRPTKGLDTPEQAAAYLDKMTHPRLGFEPLAIMYSLPYSLLIWGLLSFLLAFLLMCVINSNLKTRVFVAVAWLVIFGTVVVCIMEGRDESRQTRRWFWGSVFKLLAKLSPVVSFFPRTWVAWVPRRPRPRHPV